MRTHRPKSWLILAFIVFLLVPACGGSSFLPSVTGAPQQEPSKVAAYAEVLKNTATLYEQGMELARDLYAAKVITKAQALKIMAAARKFYAAWHSAQKALEIYVKTKDQKALDGVLAAMTLFDQNKGELIAYITTFTTASVAGNKEKK